MAKWQNRASIVNHIVNWHNYNVSLGFKIETSEIEVENEKYCKTNMHAKC